LERVVGCIYEDYLPLGMEGRVGFIETDGADCQCNSSHICMYLIFL